MGLESDSLKVRPTAIVVELKLKLAFEIEWGSRRGAGRLPAVQSHSAPKIERRMTVPSAVPRSVIG